MRFLEWATSKELATKGMLANITMARSSVWEDKAVLAKVNPGPRRDTRLCRQVRQSAGSPVHECRRRST